MPMNYEFYFLKDTGWREPEVLRVIAPSYDNAAAIVARQYGSASPSASSCGVKEYIRSLDIYPVEIMNIFGTSSP